MTVLGISASGRPDGITSEAVKAVLEATRQEYDYLSLADLQINGCRGCVRCGPDNRCKMDDDWLAVGEKMLAADAIVFGAPNYYGSVNALAHACLERTFCFRHREVFPLAGKLGVAIGVGIDVDDGEENSPVIEYIHRMMISNKMALVDSVCVSGYAQCYTCGFGEDCGAGRVVDRHGFLDTIEPEHFPPRLAEQEHASFRAYTVGKVLGSILQARSEANG